jgi:hypothetical protein
VIMQPDQSEKPWCDVTVGSHHQELRVSIGSSYLAYCYGSQARQWKKLDEVAPALCGSFLSKMWPTENGARAASEHGWPELVSIGEFQTHCLPKLQCPMIWIVHRPLWNLGLKLTKQNSPLFISLWCSGCQKFRVSPWTHDVTVW